MICDTIYGYCRKEVKLAHEIEEVYMYFNGSGIWGSETTWAVVRMRDHSAHAHSEIALLRATQTTLLVHTCQ